MTEEGRIQKAIKQYAEKRGCVVLRHAMARGVAAGWPDLQILFPGGATLFVEVKTPTGRVTPLQQHRIDTLAGMGFPAVVARSAAQGRAHIDEMFGLATSVFETGA